MDSISTSAEQPKELPFRETIDTTNPLNRTVISLLHITPEEQLNPDVAVGRKKMARALAQFFRVSAPELISGTGGMENRDTLAKGGLELGAFAGLALGAGPAAALVLPVGYIMLRGISLAADSPRVGGRIRSFLERFFIPKRKQLEEVRSKEREIVSMQNLLREDILRLQKMKDATRAKGEALQTAVIDVDVKQAHARLVQIDKFLNSNRQQLTVLETTQNDVDTKLQAARKALQLSEQLLKAAQDAKDKNKDAAQDTKLTVDLSQAQITFDSSSSSVRAYSADSARTQELRQALLNRNSGLEEESARIKVDLQLLYAQKEWYQKPLEERETLIEAERRSIEKAMSSNKRELEAAEQKLTRIQAELDNQKSLLSPLDAKLDQAVRNAEKLELEHLALRDQQDAAVADLNSAKGRLRDKKKEIPKLPTPVDPTALANLEAQRDELQAEVKRLESIANPIIMQTGTALKTFERARDESSALKTQKDTLGLDIGKLQKEVEKLEQTTIPDLQAAAATETIDPTRTASVVRQQCEIAAIKRLIKPLPTTA
ncbi:MAG: hypothetical protein WC775_05540 [Patescibacteria group bacterium]